ncbi:hypothetical protein AYK21_02340 [Thermoplasmatales archaeon SG8-52-2]|nr:MAG: hypothetical protein AYK21_02340 [Thermoplasmatales archaeon SG8-52-2]
MKESRNKFQKIIGNIEIKMIKSNEKCWIKISPIVRKYLQTNLRFVLNDEIYNFEIYDKNGIESHDFYFEAVKCNPSFCLISEEKKYKIDFNQSGIKIKSLNELNKLEDFLKQKCNNISVNSSCWAKAVYYTSRPDKPPFDEM